jgi:DnaJ-class molecular chaperone
MVFSYDGWRKDAKRAEETHREFYRARFRVLAIRLHPDKESHPQATEAFVKVRAAHDRLMASE